MDEAAYCSTHSFGHRLKLRRLETTLSNAGLKSLGSLTLLWYFPWAIPRVLKPMDLRKNTWFCSWDQK